MSFSLTLTVDATGKIEITATDCAGGCPYVVAEKQGGDLAGLSPRKARERSVAALAWSSSNDFAKVVHLRASLERAVTEIVMCLPSPETFDEDGRPVRVRA